VSAYGMLGLFLCHLTIGSEGTPLLRPELGL